MKVVVDTNVFISGVFFSGPPHTILDAWRRGLVTLVLSPEILVEYQETSRELAAAYPRVDLTPWLELVTAAAMVVEALPLPAQVCTDPDDDKFLACALASKTAVVTSGDKALLATSGFRGIAVLTPRKFVDEYLGDSDGSAHPVDD
jgi:putative PIN family toxin of toxin-antitoxin system